MPTQGTTQEAEIQRVLDNPDNFLVSAGFEHVFDDMVSPPEQPNNLVTVKYDGISVTAALLKLKLTDKSVTLKLLVPGSNLSKWISSHKSINSPCELSSKDSNCHGYISSISCLPRDTESHIVKYTILIDKNT